MLIIWASTGCPPAEQKPCECEFTLVHNFVPNAGHQLFQKSNQIGKKKKQKNSTMINKNKKGINDVGNKKKKITGRL